MRPLGARLGNKANCIILTGLVRLRLLRLLVPENGLGGSVNCGNIEQRARVNHVLGQGGLDRQLLEATVQLLPIGQQHGVKLGDLRKAIQSVFILLLSATVQLMCCAFGL